MKIVVDELPKKYKECDFAIHCKDFPSVCKLKIDSELPFGLHFGYNNKYNCELEHKDSCSHLCTIKLGD